MCWSLAILGVLKQEEEAAKKLWERALSLPPDDIVDSGLLQLYQFMLYAWGEGVDLGGMGQVLGTRVKTVVAPRSANSNDSWWVNE